MCCFSGPVEVVENTKIFARGLNGKQVLVYSMTYAALADLAMVLPLPVPPNPAEDAVTFINLEGYPDFFRDMNQCFANPDLAYLGGSILDDVSTLPVHDVGSFEASFVPRIDDFDRLDARFRLPGHVWDSVPVYRDYGFTVFKLKGNGSGGNGTRNRVHPMAFVFPRRDPERLFFPTVHVHDREVHPTAEFDHELYCQPDEQTKDHVVDWAMSYGSAARNMDIDRARETVDPDQPIWSARLRRVRENKDTVVGKRGCIPKAFPRNSELRNAIETNAAGIAEWMVVLFDPMEVLLCYSAGDVESLLRKDGRETEIYRASNVLASRETGSIGSGLTRADWLAGKR